MTVIALTNFLTITTASGSRRYEFQNGRYDNTISDNSKLPSTQPYKYLSFLYQGAAKNRSGDNLEASIILANTGSREVPTTAANKLSMNYAKEAVENKWHIEVTTCLMDANFQTIQSVLTNEKWLAATMSYDAETIEVVLSSAIDAVGANAVTRVLTSEQVGYLPVTGSLQNR
tara:strand:- start:74 stop:592 length:519 start_codon:yes stop_codon:yes gene_type:complete